MKSIKSKILIVILPLVMLGTGSIIVSFVIGLNNSTEFALQESMTATAKTAALLIQTELEGYKSVLKELAEDPVLTQPWPNATDSNYEILSQDILAHRDSILARQDLASLYVANAEGITVADSIDISNRDYFSAVKNTQSPYITDPLENRATGAFEMFAVAPIIRNGVFEGCVIAGIKPEVFSEIISHIVIGDTGSAVGVIDQTGTEIAHSQIQYVYDKINFVEMAKTDSSFADITALHQDSINGNSGFGEFNFFGEKKFMAYDRIEDSNNWGIYVVANQDVFYAQRDFYTVLGTVWAVAICIIIVIVILIVATKIAKPAKMATEQLPAIENGDFTVELKTEGNDEIAVMTNLFNSTVKKTRESLFLIHTETDNLGEIGEKLATVASDSASAVHQIAGNIESIKSQVINEAAGVAEIHATIEGIVTNVENLDGEIKKQANSIDDSMAATEEMVANIRSVTDVLEKNTAEVGKLSSAAETGRETIETTTSITEKISSKSDGLLEASNIIQGIVSQT
ncbi:MAG: methyl-accepting chemotaxis protein, partial [Spirochaetales bacterium]